MGRRAGIRRRIGRLWIRWDERGAGVFKTVERRWGWGKDRIPEIAACEAEMVGHEDDLLQNIESCRALSYVSNINAIVRVWKRSLIGSRTGLCRSLDEHAQ